jgi:hypothetical protein
VERRTYDRTLAFCNRVRKHCRLTPLTEMPQGVQKSQRHCPIAVAINHDAEVGHHRITTSDPLLAKALAEAGASLFYRKTNGWAAYMVPDYIGDFTAAFDRGEIPDLINSKTARARALLALSTHGGKPFVIKEAPPS